MVEEKFGFLFGGGGFTVVADLAYESDLYLAVIAAGSDCQVKLMLEKGSFSLHLGPSDACREWADGKGARSWRSLVTLGAFEDRLHPGQKFRPAPLRTTSSLDDTLAFYATFLRAYLPRLAAAFSQTPPRGWWAAYDAFLDARC